MNHSSAKNREISSLKELQLLMPEILKTHGDNRELMIAAAANPILALEHLGYTILPEARHEIALHIRFGKETAKTLRELEQAIFRTAGEIFDLQDPESAYKVIAPILRKDLCDAKKQSDTEVEQILEILKKPYYPQQPWGAPTEDPLLKYRRHHKLLELLTDYRKIEATAPRLSSPEIFDQILHKKRVLPLKQLQFRLQPTRQRRSKRNGS